MKKYKKGEIFEITLCFCVAERLGFVATKDGGARPLREDGHRFQLAALNFAEKNDGAEFCDNEDVIKAFCRFVFADYGGTIAGFRAAVRDKVRQSVNMKKQKLEFSAARGIEFVEQFDDDVEMYEGTIKDLIDDIGREFDGVLGFEATTEDIEELRRAEYLKTL